MTHVASNPPWGYATAAKLPVLSKVVVVGVLGSINTATLNGQPNPVFAYNASTSTLTLTNFAVNNGQAIHHRVAVECVGFNPIARG